MLTIVMMTVKIRMRIIMTDDDDDGDAGGDDDDGWAAKAYQDHKDEAMQVR